MCPHAVATQERTTASDVYALGLVQLQVIFGQPDVFKAKQAAHYVRNGENFLKFVDRLMPGDRPAGILEEVIALALSCCSFSPHQRPAVGCAVESQQANDTVIARLVEVQKKWCQPQSFGGRLAAVIGQPESNIALIK